VWQNGRAADGPAGVRRTIPGLTRRMRPTLERVAGGRLSEGSKATTAEDFSYFWREVPGLFLFRTARRRSKWAGPLRITRPASSGTSGRWCT
jgi:hypothetical protein